MNYRVLRCEYVVAETACFRMACLIMMLELGYEVSVDTDISYEIEKRVGDLVIRTIGEREK